MKIIPNSIFSLAVNRYIDFAIVAVRYPKAISFSIIVSFFISQIFLNSTYHLSGDISSGDTFAKSQETPEFLNLFGCKDRDNSRYFCFV